MSIKSKAIFGKPEVASFLCVLVFECDRIPNGRQDAWCVQAGRLEAEGVEVNDGRVDLKKYGWKMK